ncbi:hypothetical protein TSUD_211710 [Trifolium subterraneum]|uniref:Uncharacterized protein n=1 Tax=Trifolium subterraneum TaxID=3900 RepID=A0A2Z6MCB6_TRISU|nr:hypothetical protein TSUD_211710 [Trifolium subterraneum]
MYSGAMSFHLRTTGFLLPSDVKSTQICTVSVELGKLAAPLLVLGWIATLGTIGLFRWLLQCVVLAEVVMWCWTAVCVKVGGHLVIGGEEDGCCRDGGTAAIERKELEIRLT